MKVTSLEDLIASYEDKFRERRMRMNRKHHEADSQNENDSGNFEEVLSHYTEKLKESDPA